jgi:hypothetical protein
MPEIKLASSLSSILRQYLLEGLNEEKNNLSDTSARFIVGIDATFSFSRWRAVE